MGSCTWNPVPETFRLGAAIDNFNHNAMNCLKLDVGDVVHNLLECDDWYFGCLSKHKMLRGIYPKTYIHVLESHVEKTAKGELVMQRVNPLVQEATVSLREWGQLWKQLFVSRSNKFELCRFLMLEVLNHRSKLHSGNLTLDEERDLQQIIGSRIDFGNNLLGLDMVVRDDETGNVLNPESASVIQLLRQHEFASQRIKPATPISLSNPTELYSRTKKAQKRHTHMLLVTFRNFVCQIVDETELVMFLLDASEWRPFTENYVIRWTKSKNSIPDIEKLLNQRVLFTDLSNRDLHRERVFLVCYVVRIGLMDVKDEGKRSNQPSKKVPQSETSPIRRPYGVAAIDISSIISGRVETDGDEQYCAPLMFCNDGESLDSVMRRIVGSRDLQRERKGQGLWCSFKLLHGDWKQVSEENRAFVAGNPSVCKKLGFPEVILPGEVRHDLYVTLMGGDFSHSFKLGHRSIEITAQICSDSGQVNRDGVLQLGVGVPVQNEYRSVVYYHEDEPKWAETFKLAIPLDEFYHSHLRLTLKHRASNENKDRNEKPFALCFVKLMHENGTTLKDGTHDLVLYKIDQRKFVESDPAYLTLPMTRHELTDDSSKSVIPGLILNTKDCLQVSTLLCSTKLTQNFHLLGLLKYRSQQDHLESILKAFMKVDGEEIVKYIQDVFDALFNILLEHSKSSHHDSLVFDALVYVIGLIADRKYQHFRPMLDTYISNNFSATLAYKKLLSILKYYLSASRNEAIDPRVLVRTAKSFQYLFKFAVKSRQLFCNLHEEDDDTEFTEMVEDCFASLKQTIEAQADGLIPVQVSCLRYIPSVIPELLVVMNDMLLSSILGSVITSTPPARIVKDKMIALDDIVRSELFKRPHCRSILLPLIARNIRVLLDKSSEIETCAVVFCNLMEVLQKKDIGSTSEDISTIMSITLRSLIKTIIGFSRNNKFVSHLVAVLITIFSQMSAEHYYHYIATYPSYQELLEFLIELLLVFSELVTRHVFPPQWSQMILLQNSIILQALRLISHTIRDQFSDPFEIQLWENFFQCSVTFTTQPSLQLENFTQTKRRLILSQYKDMRREMGLEIRKMWYNLGRHKILFIPGNVGPFLEMSLIPGVELRKAVIEIFFDMMQCEFYSPRLSSDSHAETKRNSSLIKGNFQDFEDCIVDNLDPLVEGGRGDEHYKDLFESVLLERCEKHSVLKEQGTRFVRTVTGLMERLLVYRFVLQNDSRESQMSCIVNLLDFYHELGREALYVRYVNRLCELHLECDNFTEAAYTLQLHAQLLQWTDEPIPASLKSSRYSKCLTQRQLKEQLYKESIDFLDRGRVWECAIPLCKELIQLYEEETFEYAKLSALCTKMASMYDSVIQQVRPEPEYFRVGFYGRGFPAFLQNKVFIYRGKEWDKLSDFSRRISIQFPNADMLDKLTPPGSDITDSAQQYLQINKVDPIMVEQERFEGKIVSEKILRFYKVNQVHQFSFSRPFNRGQRDPNNPFATLWLERTTLTSSHPLPGILQWFPVVQTEFIELSPLENAIEQMETANRQLTDLILAYRAEPKLPLHPLSMKLNGILDAAVNGGNSNYERAFFTDSYLVDHPKDGELIDRLKGTFALQVSVLELGLSLHRQRVSPAEQPLQNHLDKCFSEMKAHVDEKYGKKTADLLQTVRGSKSMSRASSKASISTVDQMKTKTTPLSIFSRNSSGSLNISRSSARLSSGFRSTRNSRNLEKRLQNIRRSFTGRYSEGFSEPGSTFYWRELFPNEAVNSSLTEMPSTGDAGTDKSQNSASVSPSGQQFDHRPPEVLRSISLSRFINENLLGLGQDSPRNSCCDDEVPPPLPAKQKSNQ